MTSLTTAAPEYASAAPAPVITPDALLAHWQGHRRLTRRVIAAFPEEALFQFSVGAMRPFGALALEMLGMAVPVVRGVATGEWAFATDDATGEVPTTRDALLRRWDDATTELERRWAQIPPHRFQEVDVAFGRWEGPGHWIILYAIDNEVHHRAQGYVYLRALGVEPPPFYDRS